MKTDIQIAQEATMEPIKHVGIDRNRGRRPGILRKVQGKALC